MSISRGQLCVMLQRVTRTLPRGFLSGGPVRNIRLPRRRWQSVSRGRSILSVVPAGRASRPPAISTPKIRAASPTSSTRSARSTCCRAFRQPTGTTHDRDGRGGSVRRPISASGSAARATFRSVVGAQPAASGEGYELNFENTPVTGVAKVVLGDILQARLHDRSARAGHRHARLRAAGAEGRSALSCSKARCASAAPRW